LINQMIGGSIRSSICVHGRRKSQCKDCGTGYCKHKRQKYRCRDCGTGYCPHGRPTKGRPTKGSGPAQPNRNCTVCYPTGKANKRKRARPAEPADGIAAEAQQ
jgi:hypothetical protein